MKAHAGVEAIMPDIIRHKRGACHCHLAIFCRRQDNGRCLFRSNMKILESPGGIIHRSESCRLREKKEAGP